MKALFNLHISKLPLSLTVLIIFMAPFIIYLLYIIYFINHYMTKTPFQPHDLAIGWHLRKLHFKKVKPFWNRQILGKK